MIAVRNFSLSKSSLIVSQCRKEKVAMAMMDVVVMMDFAIEAALLLLLRVDDTKRSSSWSLLLFDLEVNKAPPPLNCPSCNNCS